jgi:hypothetical protein
MSVHYVKPSTVREGDLIRVAGRYFDADISIVGVVAKITRWRNVTEYATDKGVELFTWLGDGQLKRGTDLNVTRITLINRDPTMPPPLFDL